MITFSIFMISNFIVNAISHSKHTLKSYVICGLIGICSVMVTNKVYAYEDSEFRFLIDNNIKHFLAHINPKELTHDQRKFYMDKMDFHESNAKRCYEDAKTRCWWLPNITDRDRATYCFNAIGALCSPGTPQSRIVRALVTLMLKYGLDCMEEWDYINDKLYWAGYHWEMYEFYCVVLVEG